MHKLQYRGHPVASAHKSKRYQFVYDLPFVTWTTGQQHQHFRTADSTSSDHFFVTGTEKQHPAGVANCQPPTLFRERGGSGGLCRQDSLLDNATSRSEMNSEVAESESLMMLLPPTGSDGDFWCRPDDEKISNLVQSSASFLRQKNQHQGGMSPIIQLLGS